tara:strand:+ start:124 stop:528 length:405 start_codon:yes stop_codon:yes gene_type:complete
MKQITNLLSANVKLHLMSKTDSKYELVEDFIIRDYDSEEFDVKLDYLVSLKPNLYVELMILEQFKFDNLIYCRSHYLNSLVGYCVSANPIIDEDIVVKLRMKYIKFYSNILKTFDIKIKDNKLFELMLDIRTEE